MIKEKVQEARFCLAYEVEKDNVQLRSFLNDKEISKRTLTAIKYNGGRLAVNGIERDVRYLLHTGDKVEVLFPPERMSDGLLPEDGELDIVYEDDAILILNKKPGQSTIPSRDHRLGTIANFVAGKFVRERIPATVHVVTRLDYNTSGLLCIAKNRHIHHLLGKQINTSEFHRQYEAIVEGKIENNEFSITKSIGRKEGSIIERIVREDGQSAQTDVQVLQHFSKGTQDLTQVKLFLKTGRTHQIRVHMQSIGYPLAGDDLYGGSRTLISRQALHCTLLQFIHPITGEALRFKSNVSNDMQQLFTKMS